MPICSCGRSWRLYDGKCLQCLARSSRDERPRYGHAPTTKGQGQPLRPFSSPHYRRNSDRVGEGQWPCALCGQPVNPDEAKWVTIVDGGARFVRVGDPEVSENDPGHMGGHAVGPDCARRLAKDNVRLE